MTEFDDRFRALAKRLIDRFSGGGTVTATIGYFPPGSSGYDPTTGIASPAVEEITAPSSPPLGVRREMLGEGSPAAITDQTIYVAAVDFTDSTGAGVEPRPGMRVTVSGRSFSIVIVQPIMSGEFVAVFEIVLRGG